MDKINLANWNYVFAKAEQRVVFASERYADLQFQFEEPGLASGFIQSVSKIYKLDLSLNPKLETARDLLTLGCLTGLRFSDFSSIKPEDIRNGKLHIKQQKSDHWVVIPLRPTAHEILIIKFKGQIPRTSNPEFNEDIKKVCQIAGIDESIKFS